MPGTESNDPIKELAGMIKEMQEQVSGKLDSYKEKVDKLEEEIARYTEAAKDNKGNIVAPNLQDKDLSDSDIEALCAPFDLAYQGKHLCDKMYLKPGKKHVMSEETRKEFAKFIILFVKANEPWNDPRARAKYLDLYGPTKTGTTPVGDTGNTFVVPDIVEAEILAHQREVSIVLQNARVHEMYSEKHSWPQETSGIAVAWGNTSTESDPVAGEFELDTETLTAYSVVRRDTLMDARSDIVSWIAELMSEAAGLELDNKAWNGTGTDDPFVCSGFMTSHCGYSVTLDTGSTAFSQITGTKLSEAMEKLEGKKKDGAKWWMHGTVFHYIRDLKDDQNRPIFIDTIGGDMSGRIWGYPYTEVIKAPSSSDSAASTAFMLFGNLRNFMVGRRVGSTALEFDPYGLWTTNKFRYKIYQRWAMGMALPTAFVRIVTAA